METEESDPSTEYTEEVVEEIRSDLETEANDPCTVCTKELPDDPRIDWTTLSRGHDRRPQPLGARQDT